MPLGSNKTPQQIAAEVSGRNRTRRAQESREREADLAQHVAKHSQGEWDGVTRLGCEDCQKMLRGAL